MRRQVCAECHLTVWSDPTVGPQNSAIAPYTPGESVATQPTLRTLW